MMITSDSWQLNQGRSQCKLQLPHLKQTSARISFALCGTRTIKFIALCLCREAPRVFYLKNCSNVSLKPAWQYVMPVEMVAC